MSVGRESSVGKAKRYGVNGPGIQSRWEQDFPRRPDRTCLLHQG